MSDEQRRGSQGGESFLTEGMVSSWVGWGIVAMFQLVVRMWMEVVHWKKKKRRKIVLAP